MFSASCGFGEGQVAEGAEVYANAAAEFKRLSEPTYIRGLFEGFQRALKEKREFRWEPVLDLCEWAATRTREIPGRRAEFFEMDPHWGWTRSAVARLLTAGFTSDENPIPFEMRDRVWRALEPITQDPDPTPEQEEKYVKGGIKEESCERGMNDSCQDPLTNAINTVRSVAMEAVVKYALWVRREFEKSPDATALVSHGFDAMPEVKQLLEAHLDTDAEPSITIRAVYGEFLPQLRLLDPKWCEKNTARIIPRNDSELWHAAWDTYVCYCTPYDAVFDWLRDEYAFAVEQIGTHNHAWGNKGAPDYSLGQHLAVYYWSGKLDNDSSLLPAFFDRADGKLRGHVLSFVGRSLRNSDGAISSDITKRLMTLLEKRVEVARQHPDNAIEELAGYGWWFTCGKLDVDWSLRQLLEILRLTGRIESEHMVVEELAKTSGREPLRCVEALKMIVEGDKKGWGGIA